jgi:hypothetical protein
MFVFICRTIKKLLSDKRGNANFGDRTTHLSIAGAVVITSAGIAAAALGGTTLSNDANQASDTAACRVGNPLALECQRTQVQGSPFK